MSRRRQQRDWPTHAFTRCVVNVASRRLYLHDSLGPGPRYRRTGSSPPAQALACRPCTCHGKLAGFPKRYLDVLRAESCVLPFFHFGVLVRGVLVRTRSFFQKRGDHTSFSSFGAYCDVGFRHSALASPSSQECHPRRIASGDIVSIFGPAWPLCASTRTRRRCAPTSTSRSCDGVISTLGDTPGYMRP